MENHYYFFLYDKDMKSLDWSTTTGSEALYENGYVNFTETLQIDFYNPDGKTFKLNNLPLNEPTQSGTNRENYRIFFHKQRIVCMRNRICIISIKSHEIKIKTEKQSKNSFLITAPYNL